jgi:heptosyltransferase-2
MKKIAVFLPNWIGDVVMATPAIRALHEHFGQQATLVGIMRPYVAEVLEGTGWIDENLYFHPRAKEGGLGMWQLVRDLRQRRIDLAIALPNSFRSALLAWLSGARRRIGYDLHGRGMLLNQRVPAPRQSGRLLPTSGIDLHLELAYQAGCPPHSRRTQLETTADDVQQADEAFAALGIGRQDPVVLLNPAGGGNSNSAVRSWPAAYFTELARLIVARYDVHVLTVCGPREESLARQITRAANHPRIHSLADHPLSIGPLKAVVRRGRLMVTTDTGPRHLAAAFDVPHIALCGPIDPAWSNNHHPREIHLMQDLACRPCDQRFCKPGHHRCMRELSVPTVFAAVEHQLREDGLREGEIGVEPVRHVALPARQDSGKATRDASTIVD